jgi:hypothetical protein
VVFGSSVASRSTSKAARLLCQCTHQARNHKAWHLTAAVADHPFFRGGLPISGIFDLEPIALNYLNEKLSLDAIEIATLSPLGTLSNKRPLRLAVGGSELPELKRQSEAFAEAAQSHGLPVRLTPFFPDIIIFPFSTR